MQLSRQGGFGFDHSLGGHFDGSPSIGFCGGGWFSVLFDLGNLLFHLCELGRSATHGQQVLFPFGFFHGKTGASWIASKFIKVHLDRALFLRFPVEGQRSAAAATGVVAQDAGEFNDFQCVKADRFLGSAVAASSFGDWSRRGGDTARRHDFAVLVVDRWVCVRLFGCGNLWDLFVCQGSQRGVWASMLLSSYYYSSS